MPEAVSPARTILDNLRISLSQGAGFGTILTLVDMLPDWKSSGPDCSVDRELLQLLQHNAAIARHHLEGLAALSNLMKTEFEPARWSVAELEQIIAPFLADLAPVLHSREMTVAASPAAASTEVFIDRPRFFLAFQELMVNAYKYGRPGSPIEVAWTEVPGYVVVAVKNRIAEQDADLPADSSTLVNPFFRSHPPVEDILTVEKFGLGLGLTMVDYVMTKSGGSLAHSRVFEIGSASVPCTLAQLFLPVARKTSGGI